MKIVTKEIFMFKKKTVLREKNKSPLPQFIMCVYMKLFFFCSNDIKYNTLKELF